jgi:hypothetical protein
MRGRNEGLMLKENPINTNTYQYYQTNPRAQYYQVNPNITNKQILQKNVKIQMSNEKNHFAHSNYCSTVHH